MVRGTDNIVCTPNVIIPLYENVEVLNKIRSTIISLFRRHSSKCLPRDMERSNFGAKCVRQPLSVGGPETVRDAYAMCYCSVLYVYFCDCLYSRWQVVKFVFKLSEDEMTKTEWNTILFGMEGKHCRYVHAFVLRSKCEWFARPTGTGL